MKVTMRIVFLFLCLQGLEGAEISTIMGTGEAGFSGDGGLATKAKIRGPFGVVRGPDGCLYVCDTYNHCMRKIDAKGIATQLREMAEKRGMQAMVDWRPRLC